MKRLVCLILIVCLTAAFCPAVFAESAPESFAPGQITLLAPGTAVDLDADGDLEAPEYQILRDNDGYDTGYLLRIGDIEIEGVGWSMNENIYALKLSEYADPLLLVSDYGPSDDYETHFYLYSGDTLTFAGSIPALPEQMKVNDGVITAPIRGQLLCTWFHDADYSLASCWLDDSETRVRIYQILRYLYPMNLIVRLKVDLPLAAGMSNPDVIHTLPSGSEVILCATDDAEWVYIQSVEDGSAGWMRVPGETGTECVVGDQLLLSWDVFDGLLFAD